MLKATAAAAALTLITLVAVAATSAPPAASANGVLATPAGATLYTYDKDAANSGKSVCNAQCATNWPPLAAQPSDTGSGDCGTPSRSKVAAPVEKRYAAQTSVPSSAYVT